MASRFWRAIDLRYKAQMDEADYKKHVEPQLLQFGTMLTGFVAISILVIISGQWYGESFASTPDQPLRLASDDPRTWHFAIYFLNCVQSATTCGCLLVRSTWGRLKRMDVELLILLCIILASVLHLVGNRCTVSIILGRDPLDIWKYGDARVDEANPLLAVSLVLTIVSTMLPIRSFRLWCFPAVFSAVAVMIRIIFGAVFKAAFPTHLIMVILLAGFAFYGALHKEECNRQRWLTVRALTESCETQETELQQATALSASMQAMAGNHCDVIVKLDAQMRVWRADRCLKGFFGRHVEGLLFTDLVAEGDHTRFINLLGEALPKQPIALPMRILTCARRRCDVSMLVVNTGGQFPSHIIGINIIDDLAKPGGPAQGYEEGHDEDDIEFFGALPCQVPGPLIPFGTDSDISLCFSLTETNVTHKRIAGEISGDYVLKSEKSDASTQVEPKTTRDCGEVTSVSWGEEGFFCAACVKPPRVNEVPSRNFNTIKRIEEDGSSRSKKRSSSRRSRCSDSDQPKRGTLSDSPRSSPSPSPSLRSRTSRSRSNSGRQRRTPRTCFDGEWVLGDGYPGVNQWLTRLRISGDNVIDGNGDLVLLQWEGNTATLCGAVLTMSDDMLHRHGNSGTLFEFYRCVETGRCDFDPETGSTGIAVSTDGLDSDDDAAEEAAEYTRPGSFRSSA